MTKRMTRAFCASSFFVAIHHLRALLEIKRSNNNFHVCVVFLFFFVCF